MVFWSELRATEGGRIVVCSLNKNQSEVISWTPKGFNARTTVHEYGGGSIFVHKGHVYFSNFDDQRMYKQESPSSAPQPLTPEGKGLRYIIDNHFGLKLIFPPRGIKFCDKLSCKIYHFMF